MKMININNHNSFILLLLILLTSFLIIFLTFVRYLYRKQLLCRHFSIENEENRTMKGSLTWPEVQHVEQHSRLSLIDEYSPLKPSLTFGFKWNKETKTFHLHLIRASNLFYHRLIIDSYVRIELFSEKNPLQQIFPSVRTHIVKMSSSPIFDEYFQFEQFPSDSSSSIVATILTYDRFSRDEILGEVTFPIRIDELNDEEKVFVSEIQPRHERISNENHGEVLLSLCHQPIDQLFTIIVLKATNLRRLSSTRLINPYLKIYMFYKNQRIMKKRTTIKRTTQSPIYNECFTFPLMDKDLRKIRFDLVFFDFDQQLRHEPIGKLSIGYPDEHWIDVFQHQKSKQIAQTYRLKSFY